MNDDEANDDEGRALPLDGVLDLHTFRPRDVPDLVPTWIDACREAGLCDLRIVHGKGRGVLRDTVHALLARHPHVLTYRPAPPDRGGWGATLVTVCDVSHHPTAHPTGRKEAAPMLTFGKTGNDFTIDASQRLAAPVEALFSFFADPANLAVLSPPFLHLQILTPVPVALHEGALIDYRIKLRGIPITWRTRIDVWEPPTRFVDTQLRGPYLAWRHEHRLEPDGDGTRVSDHVAYRVPFGAPVNALLVRPDLRRVFAFRERALAARFGAR